MIIEYYSKIKNISSEKSIENNNSYSINVKNVNISDESGLSKEFNSERKKENPKNDICIFILNGLITFYG